MTINLALSVTRQYVIICGLILFGVKKRQTRKCLIFALGRDGVMKEYPILRGKQDFKIDHTNACDVKHAQ